MKKTTKIVPLNERGEPVVVSLPLSQVTEASFSWFTFNSLTSAVLILKYGDLINRLIV